MDKVFFEELSLPEPVADLGVGSGTHGYQTGEMLIRLEKALKKYSPCLVVVPGDTNSALAGGLAAVKLGIPVAHVEAGLRCNIPFMVEEINRVLLDHLSQHLFAPTATALTNLRREGLAHVAKMPGDVMADNILLFRHELTKVRIPASLRRREFAYVTVHRAENIDDEKRLAKVASIISTVAGRFGIKVAFAVHPHTRRKLEEAGLIHTLESKELLLLKPVSYLHSLRLAQDAAVVVTDSGGLQKESFLLGTPCVTLRPATEWTETVESGWNVVTDLDSKRVYEGVRGFLKSKPEQVDAISLYGNGRASERIVGSVLKSLGGS